MRALRSFFQVVDLHTLVVTLLALGSTAICQRFGVLAEIPTSLIGLAVVFPIVFSINAAYKRREDALIRLSGIKAHAVGLYYAHRDWLSSLGAGREHADRLLGLTEELLAAIARDLRPGGRSPASQRRVFEIFSQLSLSHEELRRSNLGSSEVSRANQYLSRMVADYEHIRNIASYRTPEALRAYSRVFLNLFPVAFGPYFAFLCHDSPSFPQVGYAVAVLYSLVLVTLDNLQEHLEDPFDDLGADDVKLDVFDDYKQALAA